MLIKIPVGQNTFSILKWILDYFLPNIFASNNISFYEAIKWQSLSKWVLGWLESVNQIPWSSFPDPVFIQRIDTMAQSHWWHKKERLCLSVSPIQRYTTVHLVTITDLFPCLDLTLIVKSISASNIWFLRANKQPSLPLHSTYGNSNVKRSDSEINRPNTAHDSSYFMVERRPKT